MLRKLNYTGRRKIERSEVLFDIKDKGDGKYFTVEFNLEKDCYPLSASVYVEPYYKETRQRFDFGTVGNIEIPDDTYLTKIDLTGEIAFSVLIVDESDENGKILARASGLKVGIPTDENIKGLLAIEARKIESETWKVDIDDDGVPVLVINSDIPDAINKLSDNPIFQSLIMPAAFSQILSYFVMQNDEESDIKTHWLNLGEQYAGSIPHEDVPITDKLNWVSDAINTFSKRFKFCESIIDALEDK